MRLILIRHGETEANLLNRWSGSKDLEITNLTTAGKTQAQKLGDWFRREKFIPTHVYVSPQKRAKDTANLAGSHWNIPFIVLEDLKETGAGIFEGLTWDEIESKYPEQAKNFKDSRDWSFIAESEQEKDRRDRGNRILKFVLTRHSDNDIVVMFCHAGIIQHAISCIFESPKLWGITTKNTAIFDFRLDIDKWSDASRERFNPTSWRIQRFNEIPHLT